MTFLKNLWMATLAVAVICLPVFGLAAAMMAANNHFGPGGAIATLLGALIVAFAVMATIEDRRNGQ